MMPFAPRVLLLAVLCLAAVTRVWGVSFGLPNSDARPDEVTLTQIALGLLFAGLNPRFFHWPSFEFYVLAALYRLAFEVGHLRGSFRLKFDMFRDAMANPTPYLLVPRALSVVSGVLTVWIVYRLGRRLFDEATALVAAFFVAVAFLHVRDSHFGMLDVPMTCLAVAALLPLSRALEDPTQIRSWITGGVFVGLAASTKYNAGVLVAVGLVVVLISSTASRERIPQPAIARGTVAFLTAALLAFVVGTPFAVIDYRAFLEGLRFDSRHLSEGHGIILGRGWLYHLTFSLRHGLGTPLLIASLVGMPVLAVRAWWKAAFLCTFPVLYYLILGRGYTVFVRYMIPITPFLCLTAAVAVVEVARILGRRSGWARHTLLAVLVILVALPSIRRVIAFDRLIAQTDTRVMAANWLDMRIGPTDWVGEIPAAIVHPVWGRPQNLRIGRFDIQRGLFESDKDEAVTPTWIVVARSPLAVYTTIPEGLMPIVESRYSLVATFRATAAPERADAFDRQDMFFVPYADFTARERPGPDVDIYRRRVDQ